MVARLATGRSSRQQCVTAARTGQSGDRSSIHRRADGDAFLRRRRLSSRLGTSSSIWGRCDCEQHFASELNSKQMAGGRVAHATLKGPSVVKEIFIGLTLGLIAGGMWKMHHWNEQRKTRTFYDMLEKGQISVVVEE
ncbi:hypothetical protein ACP70R_033470 [Stipagrostis hirtigluma subsp. patula]